MREVFGRLRVEIARQPGFEVVLVGELHSIHGVAEGAEQIVVGWCKVRAVRWVGQHLLTKLYQLVAGHDCSVRSGIVMDDHVSDVSVGLQRRVCPAVNSGRWHQRFHPV